KDLEKLSLAVEQFLTREKGVILLDAIEYLVTNNNFITVLRLVQSIRDQVAINNGVFLVSVNPSALDPHQLTLLEREVDRVIGSTGGSSGETSRDADRERRTAASTAFNRGDCWNGTRCTAGSMTRSVDDRECAESSQRYTILSR